MGDPRVEHNASAVDRGPKVDAPPPRRRTRPPRPLPLDVLHPDVEMHLHALGGLEHPRPYRTKVVLLELDLDLWYFDCPDVVETIRRPAGGRAGGRRSHVPAQKNCWSNVSCATSGALSTGPDILMRGRSTITVSLRVERATCVLMLESQPRPD